MKSAHPFQKKSNKKPKSLFGTDKGHEYTIKEHEEFQKNNHE